MLTYITGDLFTLLPEGRPIILPHVVNNIQRMGSGFVVPLITKWPQVKEEYMALPELVLGNVQYVAVSESPRISVANMVAQNGVVGPTNPKPIKYSALIDCMRNVAFESLNWPKDTIICAPQFGAGLAGGNWDLIEELINEIWKKNEVVVYKLA